MKNGANLMTSGSIPGIITRFAIPLFLGNLFQQLYNAVDSLIVGNFVGGDALAAVSSSGSLIFLFNGFVTGIFMGAGVVIARYFGARDDKHVQLAVHTSLAFAIGYAEFFTLIKRIAAREGSLLPYVGAAIFYYVLNLVVAVLMEKIEKKMSYYN